MTRAIALCLCLTLTACQAPLWPDPATMSEVTGVTGGLMVVTCALPFDRCRVAPEVEGLL